MELIKSSNIETKREGDKVGQKDLFEFKDIDAYLELERFAINVGDITSSRILFVLTSINTGYKVYRGDSIYYSKLNFVYDLLKEHSILFHERKKGMAIQYYCVLKREDFLKYESVLFEVCLLFRFSAFVGLRDDVTAFDILRILNRLSIHSILSFERWKKVLEWILFFDGEHFAGNLIVPSK